MTKNLPPDPYFPDDESAKEPAKTEPEPVEKVSRKKHSTPHGPRYSVGLQKDDDPQCWVDFFETEKLSEAKEEAKKALEKHSKKSVIIYDRKSCPAIIEKYEPPKSEEIKTEVKETKKKAKGIVRK